MTSPYPPQPPVPATPAPRHYLPLFLLLGAVALLVLAGGAVTALYLGNVGPFKDSGLAMCESMRDSATVGDAFDLDGTAGRGLDRLTEAEYQELRSRFADSRYDDIRDTGTAFMDLAWQVNGGTTANVLGALLVLGGQMIQSYSSLSGACAAHGVTIPPLLSR